MLYMLISYLNLIAKLIINFICCKYFRSTVASCILLIFNDIYSSSKIKVYKLLLLYDIINVDGQISEIDPVVKRGLA